MNRIEKLIEEIKSSVFGNPWHGSSLKTILSDINENQSNMRVIKNAHTIKELVLHLIAWTDEVTSRLTGKEPDEPQIGDWPDPQNFKNDNFDSLKDRLFIAANNLIEVLKSINEEKLDQIVGTEINPSFGTGVSFETMIIGLLQHNAYHSGQIGIMKKAF